MTISVAIDATAVPHHRVGAGTYVAELVRGLDGLEEVQMQLFVNTRDAQEFATLAPAARVHRVRVPNRPARILWGHFVLPLRVARIPADVFHGPHYTLPAGLRIPSVVTFHDPTFFTMPELHERTKVAYFTAAARRGIGRASRVIAVSEYAKRGAVESAGASADRVDVVHHGVDLERYRPSSKMRPDEDSYILFVGTLEPRKDVPTLIGAYEDLVVSGFKHRLVLCGPPGWGVGAIERAIDEVRAGTVQRTGYVSEDEKIALYQGASVMVYPSIAEGFGLPVLEAMACGTPVITTSGSAPEEIAGGAAVLVPPRDRVALRDAMAHVLTDETLGEELHTRGRSRATEFSWDRTAQRMIDVYRRASS